MAKTISKCEKCKNILGYKIEEIKSSNQQDTFRCMKCGHHNYSKDIIIENEYSQEEVDFINEHNRTTQRAELGRLKNALKGVLLADSFEETYPKIKVVLGINNKITYFKADDLFDKIDKDIDSVFAQHGLVEVKK